MFSFALCNINVLQTTVNVFNVLFAFFNLEDLLSSGRLKLCLTATVISFLNKCFDDSQEFSGTVT